MEFQIKKLARVGVESVADLPDSPGIYFAIDPAFRVWYIGISTTSLRDRHRSHHRIADFKEYSVQWIAYMVYNDDEDLKEWEIEAIAKFRPPLNQTHMEYDLPVIDLGYDRSQFLSRYKEIKLMQKALEEELEWLKPNIISLLDEHEGRIKTSEFNVWKTCRKTWQYSSMIEKLQEHIKMLKKKEEDDGTATVKSTTVFPVVR
jgi:hypothetical protein